MTTTRLAQSLPLTEATDASALARLRAMPAAETERLLDALATLPDAGAQQDHLITHQRVALSLPALAAWLGERHAARAEHRFQEFLEEVRRAAGRAEAFHALLGQAETLRQTNVALLAAALFDALVRKDAPAIERMAHAFAEVVGKAEGGRQKAEG